MLFAYRLPREPSTPRIGIWRKLERLGVARLGDGLVCLPADARTREQIDWLAEQVIEAGGIATVWLATAGSTAQERTIATTMRAARAAEYQDVIEHARAALRGGTVERTHAARRLRGELRRIARRDYFPPVERDIARSAVNDLPADPAPMAAAPAEAAVEEGA